MSKTDSKKSAPKSTTSTRKKSQKPSKGLGDTIEKVTKATGIKAAVKFIAGEDCGCDERKAKLNELMPYKITCMTEQDYIKWTKFREEDSDTLEKADRELVARMHAKLFNHQLTYPCTCSPKTWMKYIKEINHMYNSYEEDKAAD